MGFPSFVDRWLFPVHGPYRKGTRHADLTVGLVADDLTRACFEQECRVVNLTPANYRDALRRRRPDFILVESAWAGFRSAWRFRIASYAEHPERNNHEIVALASTARDLGIPTVFMNKEDGVHFDRFIASARAFDHVFTVDANCVERYRREVDRTVTVDPMLFAVDPYLHRFDGITYRQARACFVGSYSRHVHDGRRDRQQMLLHVAACSLGLNIYDRNSDRRSANYRYPDLPNTAVLNKVPYEMTGAIYKSHMVSLNVNTIEDSETMFSRRLVEIMACGGLAVSTPARSIDRWFKDYCHVVDSDDQAIELFSRLARDGYAELDCEMMRAGADYVARNHTWSQRIDTMLETIASKTRSAAA